jgi:hypothetical protein
MKTQNRRLRVGDWVEVKSREEILRTLDGDGQLDGMPFMPEMFEFCGRKFQVYKRAHKSCDPDLRSRRIRNAVHLETRCDGQAHGGCQAGCLIFWNQAWLNPVGGHTPELLRSGRKPHAALVSIAPARTCSESVVRDRVRAPDADGGGFSYVCQMTQVQHQTLIAWWDVRQYIEDYSSGNVTLGRLLSGTAYSMYFNLSQSGLGLGRAMRWLYEKARPIWGGTAWPRKKGLIPAGQSTPAATLNLQPGELVRVRPHEEILRTVNAQNKNRGLWWDAELVPYCGKTYRVIGSVTNIINEKTGKMEVMKNPCIVLDTVVCQARYSACRMFCPKSTYAYWREIWLERVGPPVSGDRKYSSHTAALPPACPPAILIPAGNTPAALSPVPSEHLAG